QQTKMFTSMLDQQMSQNLAKRGVGLADVLIRQLSQTANAQALAIGSDQGAPAADAMLPGLDAAALLRARPANLQQLQAPLQPAADGQGTQPSHIRAFQDKLGAVADEVSRASGIPAKFMLGQAALETGWGKR